MRAPGPTRDRPQRETRPSPRSSTRTFERRCGRVARRGRSRGARDRGAHPARVRPHRRTPRARLGRPPRRLLRGMSRARQTWRDDRLAARRVPLGHRRAGRDDRCCDPRQRWLSGARCASRDRRCLPPPSPMWTRTRPHATWLSRSSAMRSRRRVPARWSSVVETSRSTRRGRRCLRRATPSRVRSSRGCSHRSLCQSRSSQEPLAETHAIH